MELEIRRRFSLGDTAEDRNEEILQRMADDIQGITNSLVRIEMHVAKTAASVAASAAGSPMQMDGGVRHHASATSSMPPPPMTTHLPSVGAEGTSLVLLPPNRNSIHQNGSGGDNIPMQQQRSFHHGSSRTSGQQGSSVLLPDNFLGGASPTAAPQSPLLPKHDSVISFVSNEGGESPDNWNLKVRKSKSAGATGGDSGAPDATSKNQSQGNTSEKDPLEGRRKSTVSGGVFSSTGMSGNESTLLQKLGSSWPACIPLRNRLRGGNANSESSSRVTEALTLQGQLGRGAAHGMRGGLRRGFHLPLDPNASVVICLDLIKFFVLLHDIAFIPYILAWNVPPTSLLFILESITACYWSIDCVLNFLMGFYSKGELVMDWGDIFKHYIRTWFTLDILLLSTDLTTIALSARRIGKRPSGAMFQIVRSARVLKLLRLIRFASLVNKLSSLSLSATKASVAQMLRIPLALVVYNHLVACAWGVIGRLAPTDVDHRWLDHPVDPENAESEKVLSDLDPWQQYAAAMHWTLAQMTPGPIDIVATSILERIFNCGVLIAGLLFGSMIVSQFSGHIMRATMLKRDRTQKIDTIRKFLQQREVSPKLSLRVQKQVIQRLNEEVPLQVRDVPGFQVLSSLLKSELLHEVRLPHLLTHPVFQMWASLDYRSVLSICETAVEFAFLSPQDVLFTQWTDGNEAYAVMSGFMQYTLDDALMEEIVDRDYVEAKTFIQKGKWICEVALWSHWTHVGKAEAQVASELLVLSASGLMKELDRDHFACHMMKHYGRSYHLRVTSAMPPFTDWPTDIHVPYTDFSDLVGADVSIGMLNNAMANNKLSLSDEARDELEQELRHEKCALRFANDGSMERTVAVVALRMLDEDNNILVELAKMEAGKAPKASCSLPGHKRAMSEVPQSAIRRLLWKRFAPIKDHIILERTEHEVVKMDSSAYAGLTTTYQRSIYIGRCEEATVFRDMEWKVLIPTLRVPERLREFDVYVAVDTKSGGGWSLWAWLDTFTFEWAKSEPGTKAVQAWAQQVDITRILDEGPLPTATATIVHDSKPQTGRQSRVQVIVPRALASPHDDDDEEAPAQPVFEMTC